MARQAPIRHWSKSELGVGLAAADEVDPGQVGRRNPRRRQGGPTRDNGALEQRAGEGVELFPAQGSVVC
ncbi:hypothetical protein Ais01nite_11430 [Asanoa ishikariensis]|nr:hypothetical protein Ais01nite_11430 [Asanoa ishikariensis]